VKVDLARQMRLHGVIKDWPRDPRYATRAQREAAAEVLCVDIMVVRELEEARSIIQSLRRLIDHDDVRIANFAVNSYFWEELAELDHRIDAIGLSTTSLAASTSVRTSEPVSVAALPALDPSNQLRREESCDE
jgi:hypothetical protein